MAKGTDGTASPQEPVWLPLPGLPERVAKHLACTLEHARLQIENGVRAIRRLVRVRGLTAEGWPVSPLPAIVRGELEVDWEKGLVKLSNGSQEVVYELEVSEADAVAAGLLPPTADLHDVLSERLEQILGDFTIPLRPRFDQVVEIVIELGELASDKSGEKTGRGDRARAYFKAFSEILNLYASPENFIHDVPQCEFSRRLAQNLGGLLEHLSTGKIPEPFKHCARRGNIVVPSESRDIRQAVIYVQAVKRQLIADKAPIKTVTDLYGCGDRRSVQGWVKRFANTVTEDELAVDPDLIDTRMRKAASRYADAGRSRKAVAQRDSKGRRGK